jgi:hypothetical protein
MGSLKNLKAERKDLRIMPTTAVATRFDPWGPVSTVLYEINDSDFLQNAVAKTGITIDWTPMTKGESYSHGTRIRAMRGDINAAYSGLSDDKKGHFVQIIVKAILKRHDATDVGVKIKDALHDIGWTISEEGELRTEDALISEAFFPPNTEFDAYMAIREILDTAAREIVVVDPYIGASLLLTLKALTARNLSVRFLTVERNLKPDFRVEFATFRKQVTHIGIEVRTTADFHDRFIAIDGSVFYHVGASIKDAGKRAFMISRIQDQPNIDGARQSIDRAWATGAVYE